MSGKSATSDQTGTGQRALDFMLLNPITEEKKRKNKNPQAVGRQQLNVPASILIIALFRIVFHFFLTVRNYLFFSMRAEFLALSPG